MISFVWSPGERLPAGTGGSENFTVGQVRELNRRAIDARVVTVGLGTADGRDEFDDIPFHCVPTLDALGRLDDTLVFVSEAPPTATMHPAYQILHVPPPLRQREQASVVSGTRNRTLVATSRYAAALWADFLDVGLETIRVVYPFAEPSFADPSPGRAGTDRRDPRAVRRAADAREGHLHTPLDAAHRPVRARIHHRHRHLRRRRPAAGRDHRRLLQSHPGIDLVAARRTPADMATLLVEHDIVVMPSNAQYWHETFGILSIEAQHAGAEWSRRMTVGCRRPTAARWCWCEPDDAEALAQGIVAARRLGPRPRLRVRAAAGLHRRRVGGRSPGRPPDHARADPVGGHPGARGAGGTPLRRRVRTIVGDLVPLLQPRHAACPRPCERGGDGERLDAADAARAGWGTRAGRQRDRPTLPRGGRHGPRARSWTPASGRGPELASRGASGRPRGPVGPDGTGSRPSRPSSTTGAGAASETPRSSAADGSRVAARRRRPTRDFLERLTAYTHASTADARAEMVAGASRSARLPARQAIHAGRPPAGRARELLPATPPRSPPPCPRTTRSIAGATTAGHGRGLRR